MFPRDAITVISTQFNPATYTIINASTSPYTILEAYISDNTGATQSIYVGSIALYEKYGNTSYPPVSFNYTFTNQTVKFVKTNTASSTVVLVYVPRNRATTPDPEQWLYSATNTPVTVLNFPTGFNVNNWTFATSTFVTNFSSSTLKGLNVICTSGCTSTGTSTGSSTIIVNGNYNGPNYQEYLFTMCVVIGIISLALWRFIFRNPKSI
jgi:hypothetical protein